MHYARKPSYMPIMVWAADHHTALHTAALTRNRLLPQMTRRPP